MRISFFDSFLVLSRGDLLTKGLYMTISPLISSNLLALLSIVVLRRL